MSIDLSPSNSPVYSGNAILKAFKKGYGGRDLLLDLGAGLTVGIIALPLSMALAIASGVAPQHGIYTAIVAGAIIALLGGSRFNVSGPTAAFVVLLYPISAKFGVGGLMMASVIAGLVLMLMGIARLGRLIQFIPHPVTTGFTAGIAVVIALLQVKDFLGLTLSSQPDHTLEKVVALIRDVHTFQRPDTMIGLLTLAILIVWPKLGTKVPAPLVAVTLATIAGALMTTYIPEFVINTIGSRFRYVLNGVEGHGVPPALPSFKYPWQQPGGDGMPIGMSLDTLQQLMNPALAIAALGAIESLLCAVVADGMKGENHNPDTELIAQGMGNFIAPFFGGFAATGAIARTAASIRAGSRSPIAALIHALFLVVALLLLAPLMSYLPMSALAAMLLMVAWNMSDLKHVRHILHVAPRSDKLVFLACFSLTVVFDMVVAVTAGVVLASVLFIKRMRELTGGQILTDYVEHSDREPPPRTLVYHIAGPMFFGAAEKATSEIARMEVGREIRRVILNMSHVPMMDMTGLVALESVIDRLRASRVSIYLSGMNAETRGLIEKSRSAKGDPLVYAKNLHEALILAEEEAKLDALRRSSSGRVKKLA